MTPKFLNRYTTLPILIDALWRKEVTLLPPQSWEDRNDAYYLERYQQVKALGSVLALCFSTKRETFHHWRVFSHGTSGVCIEFDGKKFLRRVHGDPDFRSGSVKYSRIDKVERTRPAVGQWPFLKRLPFQDEREFRIIYESLTAGDTKKLLGFDIEAVNRITLSPWMPKAVAESVIEVIKSIDGCSELHVYRSSLIENGRWKNAIRRERPTLSVQL